MLITFFFPRDQEREILEGEEREKEELNEIYGEEELEETSPSVSTGEKVSGIGIKIFALLVVLAFLTFALGDFFRLIALPSLDFLRESRELSHDPLVQELRQGVVQVRVEGRGSSRGGSHQVRGTGFNIDEEGIIVTNSHLVEGAEAVQVSFLHKGVFQSYRWVKSPREDLAVIFLEQEEKDLPSLSLAEELPLSGEEVLILGNPLGFPRVATRGTVLEYRQVRINGPPEQVMEIKAPIHQGNSGSPVFNEGGEVVAVVYGTLGRGEGEDIVGLAVTLPLLEEFLEGEGVKAGKKPITDK